MDSITSPLFKKIFDSAMPFAMIELRGNSREKTIFMLITLVLSGQPKIGSINKITDTDVISPLMQCIHIYAYKRKKKGAAQPDED